MNVCKILLSIIVLELGILIVQFIIKKYKKDKPKSLYRSHICEGLYIKGGG